MPAAIEITAHWALLTEIEMLEELLRECLHSASEDDAEAVQAIALSRALALRRQALRAGFAAVA
jgi:hypothetical protein